MMFSSDGMRQYDFDSELDMQSGTNVLALPISHLNTPEYY
jgi:hypothetical protein